MSTDGTSFLALVIMGGLSAALWFTYRRGERVPMQWGLRGKPTWFAPRWLAALFTPVLFVIVTAALRMGGETTALAGGRILVALIFVLIHALHVIFARRYRRKQKA